MSANVAILLVTYNCADWVRRCLDSLDAALDGQPAEIIVVDNASADDSADLANAHPRVTRVERNERNLGFAAAVNRAAELSTAPWLLLLNPDTEARPHAVANLLEFAGRYPDNGIYGGRTLRPDGALEPSSCWALPTVWSLFCFASGLSTLFARSALFDPESMGGWARDSVREVGMVTGCLLLVTREVWQRLDGLDPTFFVYGEDADFAARARKLGYRPIVTPDSEVIHAVGASSSSGTKTVLLLAGRLTYARRHFSGWRRPVAVGLIRLGVFVRAAGAKLSGRGSKWLLAWQRRRQWWSGFPSGGSAVAAARPPASSG